MESHSQSRGQSDNNIKRKGNKYPDLIVESASMQNSERANVNVQEDIMDKIRNSGITNNASINYLINNPHKIHGISTAGARFLEFLRMQQNNGSDNKEKFRKSQHKQYLQTHFNINKYPPFISKPTFNNGSQKFPNESEKTRFKLIQTEMSKLRINLEYNNEDYIKFNLIKSFVSKY